MLFRYVTLCAFLFIVAFVNTGTILFAQDFFVADRLGNRVIEYNNDGSLDHVLIGPADTGSVGKPTSLTLIPGATGTELLVGSTETGRIARFNATTGNYLGEFVAPGIGVSGMKTFYNATAGQTQVLVSDFGGTGVRRYDTSGNLINTFGGGIGAFSSLDFGGDGNIYTASYFGGVYKFNPITGAQFGTGSITTYNGQGVGEAGIQFLPNGNFVASLDFLSGGLEVTRYDASGVAINPVPFIDIYNPANSAAGGTAYTQGFLVDNNSLLVTNEGNNNPADPYYTTTLFNGFIGKYALDGTYLGNFISAPDANAFGPTAIILDVNPVPEPSTIAFAVVFGLVMLGYVAHSRLKSA